MKRGIFLFLVLYVSVISCSPFRKINMRNQSGRDVEITWTIKEADSLFTNPFFISNSRTLTFELKPDKPYNEVKMSFGVGSWPRDTLAILTKTLESLEIKSSNGIIQLKSPEDIYAFLLSRRKGIGNRKIEILITK
jgi:hypothetical protein